ncbi:MAG: ribbon-helix-helix protein, CopG family [Chloroflexi bacterium]|nr:ribbon-helix-helix protein, CopG family [Chloroflexota bacterium]
MKRTTIVADEGLLLEIRQLAEDQNHSVSDVIQEALREYLKNRRAKRGKISFIAVGNSGRSDVSERAEEILQADANREKGWM